MIIEFTRFPVEIQLHIVSLLDSPLALVQLRLVNRRFKDFCSREEVKQSVCISWLRGPLVAQRDMKAVHLLLSEWIGPVEHLSFQLCLLESRIFGFSREFNSLNHACSNLRYMLKNIACSQIPGDW